MQAVTRVIAGHTRRAYVRVRFCQAPKQFPVRTERASTYACTGRVSTGLVCTSRGTRGVRLLSCRVCRAVRPASSRLRVISTTLSRCSDLRRSKDNDFNRYINCKKYKNWQKNALDKPQSFYNPEDYDTGKKVYKAINQFYKLCVPVNKRNIL